MRVLVDTSVWSLALRRGARAQNPEASIPEAQIPEAPIPEAIELRKLIAAHVAEIIGPIRQELLFGIRDPAQFGSLASHLAAFVDLPLLSEDYVTAAKFFNLCRSKGIQGSNTDFLICAVAARHSLAVFATDGDFLHFAKCLPVVLHEFRKTPAPKPEHSRRPTPKREA